MEDINKEHTNIDFKSTETMILNKAGWFNKDQIKQFIEKLVVIDSNVSTDSTELIYYNQYDNGDDYIDIDGYYLGRKFNQWFIDNIK